MDGIPILGSLARRCACAAVAAFGLCCHAEPAPAEWLTLSVSGTPQVVIGIASNAPETERHAADELARWLGKVTGARFEIGSLTNSAAPRILVGPEAARLADPAFNPSVVGPEGVILRHQGRDLILAGGSPRGTLYAVYTFLEDSVGCRWLSSTVNYMPEKPVLTITRLDRIYTPPFDYREPFYFDAFDADWAARNKVNGYRNRIDALRGGHHRFAQFAHTFYKYLPPTNYFGSHPDWYSELDGKRTAEKGQLCLSNPEMTAEFIRQVKADLKAKPGVTMVSVSQNDGAGFCTCPACAAVDAEEGSPSGSILRFVNRVAEALEPEFPEVTVSTLAYTYSQKPPRVTRPRRHVSVWLCSMGASHRLPLVAQRDRPFAQDFRDWSRLCDQLYVWDYVVNFIHYTLPHPNLNVLGPNIRFFSEQGAKGVFSQGAYRTGGTEMAELRAWVTAKLMWNPDLDDRALIADFIKCYYGRAAPYVTLYLDDVQREASRTNDLMGCYSKPDEKFLNAGLLVRSCGYFARAELLMKDEPAFLKRVKTAKLPILYLALVRWNELRAEAAAAKLAWPLGDDPQAVLRTYEADAREAGLTQTGEHRDGFGWLEQAVADGMAKAAADQH